MTNNSIQMMGSKLVLKQLSENTTGPDSKFLWYGKVMGFTMGFTVVVTKWIKEKEKVWETVGETKMIIMKWYRMQLLVIPYLQSTKVTLSIAYTKPDNIFFKFVAFFLAPMYANWCLNNMLNGSKKDLENKTFKQAEGGVQV